MATELTDEKRKYYKDRLAHYLRSYRERHNLSQQETAKKINYALDHYKRLEAGIEERMANTIEFLTNFALLDFGNVIDFIVYLENTARPNEDRKLYPWEESLLQGFNELPLETRRDFTSAYCADKPKGPWSLAEIVEFSRTMASLGDTERVLVEMLIARLQKRELTKMEKGRMAAVLSEFSKE